MQKDCMDYPDVMFEILNYLLPPNVHPYPDQHDG